jgi:hypothetical protein
MKRNILITIFFTTIAMACNNSKEESTGDNLKASADSLFEKVMEGHDIGMAKTPSLKTMREQAKKMIDSIGKLPAKAQEAAAPYKAKIDSLVKDLDYAEFAMDKWMDEFKYDSAKNDLKRRIEYLTNENSKVGKVKEAILGSLQKADSLLKKSIQ